MNFIILLVQLSALSFVGATSIAAQLNVEQYVETEGPIAKAGMLANIGPFGSKSSGAKAGIVIASPSVGVFFPLPVQDTS